MLLRLFKKSPPSESEGAGAKAGRLYDSGLNCTQAVLQAVTGLDDPALMKMAKGFGAGIGESGCLCGAITGGVMALGFAGESKKAGKLVEEFKRANRTTCCRGLTKDFKWMGREHIANCRRLTVETAEMVERLLEQ